MAKDSFDRRRPYNDLPSIQFLEKAGIAKRQAASEYLYELVRIGVLTAEKKGRDVLFRNRKLMDILVPNPGRGHIIGGGVGGRVIG
jgi:hypothetical protein